MRQHRGTKPRLWIGDRLFCDLKQIPLLAAGGDSFLLRYQSKVGFHREQDWVQDGMQTAAQVRAYLRRRLAGVWDDRWQKAATTRRAPKGKTQYLKGGHSSVYRILHGLHEVRSEPAKSKP